MTFKYYIVSVFNGNITGTNDDAHAEDMRGSEDDFVIDTSTNEWLLAEERESIPAYVPYVAEP